MTNSITASYYILSYQLSLAQLCRNFTIEHYIYDSLVLLSMHEDLTSNDCILLFTPYHITSYSVTAGSLCNILEQAYQCTIIIRSHWSCLYNILLCHAYIICYVSERSSVLHAYLNPFVHTCTMSLEDTIRDYLIFEYCSDMITGLLSSIV